MAGNPFYYQNGQQPQTMLYQQPMNPYTQPMTTAYTPSTSRSSTLYGRVVNSPNDITPNEVPMDGSVSLFPSSDYSCILAKTWNRDGTIQTVKFVPEVNPDQVTLDQASQENTMDTILKKLDAIEKKLNYRPKNKPPYKKWEDTSRKETKED